MLILSHSLGWKVKEMELGFAAALQDVLEVTLDSCVFLH